MEYKPVGNAEKNVFSSPKSKLLQTTESRKMWETIHNCIKSSCLERFLQVLLCECLWDHDKDSSQLLILYIPVASRWPRLGDEYLRDGMNLCNHASFHTEYVDLKDKAMAQCLCSNLNGFGSFNQTFSVHFLHRCASLWRFGKFHKCNSFGLFCMFVFYQPYILDFPKGRKMVPNIVFSDRFASY